MRTLNLSGFKTSDSFSISVSQGALTAGPYNVPAWGGGGGGGVISIVVPFRSQTQFAPDTVTFEVDLSEATFDTQGPTGAETYDARLHDLIYFWDFDAPRTWQAPQNIIAAWKNANAARGPKVAHLYTAPGSYSPSVMVYEPASGKVASAVISSPIVVGSEDAYFGDANTMYVRPTADTDESWIPAGVPPENRIAADSLRKLRYLDGSWVADDNWASRSWDGQGSPVEPAPTRWRFKRGGTYQVTIYMDGFDPSKVLFCDYGDPLQPKPILTTPESPVPASYDLQMFFMGAGHGQFEATGVPPEHRYINLDMRGNFDPAVSAPDTGVGELSGALGGTGNKAYYWTVVHKCDFSGFGVTNIGFVDNAELPKSSTAVLHIDDCTMKDFGGQYPIFGSTGYGAGAKQYRAFTGLRSTQKPDALNGARALCRVDYSPFIYVQGCDMFHADRLYSCWDLAKTSKVDGELVVMYGNASEGALFLSLNGNESQTPRRGPYQVNLICDSFIHVATNEFQMCMRIVASGLTVRNGIWIVPDKQQINGVMGFVSLVGTDGTEYPGGTTTPSEIFDAPIRFENCTFRCDQDTTVGIGQTAMKPWFETQNPNNMANYTNVQLIDAVLHGPQKSPVVNGGPFTDTVLWQARNTGIRLNSAPGVFDTSYAAPADCVVLTQPTTGSSAIGTATGDGAYRDALGSNFKGDRGWVQSA